MKEEINNYNKNKNKILLILAIKCEGHNNHYEINMSLKIIYDNISLIMRKLCKDLKYSYSIIHL